MSFNVPHYGTISAGNTGSGPASMPVNYSLNNHQDLGAIFAEGDPEQSGAFLVSDQQRIIRHDGGAVSYAFQLTSFRNATSFKLAGGGLINGFNVPHWGTIGAGDTGSGPASMRVDYSLNNGQDLGAIFAEGDPENPGASLVSDQQRIVRDNGGVVSYAFQLTNYGRATDFKLAGGGLNNGFNIPYGTIGAGNTGSGPTSMPVVHVFGNGADVGAIFAEGDPENPGASLVSDHEEIDRLDDGSTIYLFQLTNFGNATFFKLVGGTLN